MIAVAQEPKIRGLQWTEMFSAFSFQVARLLTKGVTPQPFKKNGTIYCVPFHLTRQGSATNFRFKILWFQYRKERKCRIVI